MLSERSIREHLAAAREALQGWREPDGYLLTTEPDPAEREQIRAGLNAAISAYRRVLNDKHAPATATVMYPIDPQPFRVNGTTGPMYGHRDLGGHFAEHVMAGVMLALQECPHGAAARVERVGTEGTWAWVVPINASTLACERCGDRGWVIGECRIGECRPRETCGVCKGNGAKPATSTPATPEPRR